MSLFAFEDNDVVIPMIVLEELDHNKIRSDDVGRNARTTNRLLDDLRKEGSLFDGVKLSSGGTLKITSINFDDIDNVLPLEFDKKKPDNLIIATALWLQSRLETPVQLITKDISMRLKCDALKVSCDDYLKHRIIDTSESIYGGVSVINCTKKLLDAFHRHHELDADDLDVDEPLNPNQFVVLKAHGSGSGLARIIGNKVKAIQNIKNVWGLSPKNKEQQFALNMLMDDNVNFCTLVGQAGGGKTLLAVAAGLQQVLEEKKYTKLIITRPIQPVGRDIGYLPGTKEEKMEPWIQPIKDNLSFLFGANKSGKENTQMYFDAGLIEVEALTYIRGRSIPNAYIIVDEAQNLSVHEVRTIITRAGEGTKIVMTGDIAQIDNEQIDAMSNGLTYAVEKFKGYDIAGHITLIKGERSSLATLAAEIL